ncbi:MAG: hypothetical protein P1U81_05455 [Verrucomicrobiales bacterium]|jgi:hypothetical protein|nr:hypothetical protein [Verrucomicrobiales bacterium]
MKLLRAFSVLSLPFFALAFVSCETVDSGPKPEREKLSSIPHNMPESWEGQAGFPGQMGGGY